MNSEQTYQRIENKFKKLLEKAIEIMKTVEDSKHSLSHVKAVVNYTKEILDKVEQANKEVCLISAY